MVSVIWRFAKELDSNRDAREQKTDTNLLMQPGNSPDGERRWMDRRFLCTYCLH
jgi:hypothetical protein